MVEHWYDSRFTGLFTRFGPVPPQPHDPDIAVWAGTSPAWGARRQELAAGGAGWDAAAAEAACVGEALERLQPYPLPDDQGVVTSFAAWHLDEAAVDPDRWVLFHGEQYAQPDFPFEPFTEKTSCRWVCFRQAATGLPSWVPEELAYLFARPQDNHRICPAVSTGLSCGRARQPVLLRGLQEVIERDAVVGAWWGRYSLEAAEPDEVLGMLEESVARRILRPNLTYRFYRVQSPFSAHVTLVTVEGEDREGFCFSIGSACREARPAAWLKAILEAIHGRHYVRYLLKERRSPRRRNPARMPADFTEHAVHYSLHPDELSRTVLRRAQSRSTDKQEGRFDHLPTLIERLGPDRPVLFRNMTPPGIAAEVPDWYVLKVLVPGLQPLHGSHYLPHLGGFLWAPRGLAEWADMPPHPFP